MNLMDESLRQDDEFERLFGIRWESLGPGVRGYAFEYEMDIGPVVYFGIVEAENEGNGDVGRWLDSLPTDKTFRIPNVINPRLEGMLRRRGWETSWEWFDAADEQVLVYERRART